jgi:hypothetical protein
MEPSHQRAGRAQSRALASILTLLLAVAAFGCATAASPEMGATPSAAAAFGSPPSGEYPILYNDHTVYATPDILKQSRVLAALIRDGQIYVPLRSMFEQMGATVTVSADGKTTTAVKPGASVSVTLDSNQVVINGETRPLDVPPILYHGIVLVPVRVLSEALGAYVQWVPDRRIVVVRYIPATPPPSPTPSPTPAPEIVPPTPMPTATPYTLFVQAGMAAGSNYNEFSSGQYCPKSYVASGAWVIGSSGFAIKADYRSDSYVTNSNLTVPSGNQYTRFSTIDGGTAYTPVFLARQSTLDGRLLYQVAPSHVYVGIGYIQTSTNYGYPQLTGVGAGIEKLPDLRPGIGFYGSAFYYPSASGTYTVGSGSNAGTALRQRYAITKYDIGASLTFGHAPIYLYGGFSGDRYAAKEHAPIDQTHGGPYLGLGMKF